MLVLSMDEFNDVITINHAGETLEVVLVEQRAGRCRMGFEGPLSFRIVRSNAINKQREDREAGSDPDGAAGSAGAPRATEAD